jgi:hypothetical protein
MGNEQVHHIPAHSGWIVDMSYAWADLAEPEDGEPDRVWFSVIEWVRRPEGETSALCIGPVGFALGVHVAEVNPFGEGCVLRMVTDEELSAKWSKGDPRRGLHGEG